MIDDNIFILGWSNPLREYAFILPEIGPFHFHCWCLMQSRCGFFSFNEKEEQVKIIFVVYYTTLCHKCCQLSLTRIEPFKASFKIITDLVTTLNRFGTPWKSPSFRSHAVCFNLVQLFSNSSHVWKVSRGN